MSLAVYHAKTGAMFREVLRGERLKGGRHVVTWDGLDRWGKPVPPGTYEWRLLLSQGFQAEYLMQLGTNSPDSPYATWVGNHFPVACVAVDETGVYFGSPAVEGPPMLVKFSPDLKTRLWEHYSKHDGHYPAALTSTGGKLFALNGLKSHSLRRYDAAKGTIEATWKVTWDGAFAHDLDARGSTLVLSYPEKNAIRLLDPATGEVLESVPVPQPRGVAVALDGTILVLSGDKLLSIGKDREPVERIAGLDAPHRLASDPKSGEIYVGETGKTFQIRKYDKAFQLMTSFGTKGGRKDGRFVPEDFRTAHDLAADGKGQFFVIEIDAPRRTSLVSGKDGSIQGEWFGGQAFYCYTFINPDDPTEVWFENHVGAVTRVEVDHEKKTWKPLASYSVPGEGGGQGDFTVRRHKNATYLISVSGPRIFRVDEGKGKLTLVAAVGVKPDGRPFTWADANENGVEEASELRFAAKGAKAPGHVACLTAGMDIYFKAGWESPAFYQLKRSGWAGTDKSIPTYDWADLRTGPMVPPELKNSPDNAGRFHADATGNLYQPFFANRMPGEERHGDYWPANENAVCRLVKWDPEGNLLFSVGRHRVQADSPPGQISWAARVVGAVDGTVLLIDRGGGGHCPYQFWTTDGLYAGTAMDHRAKDGAPDAIYRWWKQRDDTVVGALVQMPKGDVLLYSVGVNCNLLYRLTGWDNLQRQKGMVVVKAAPAAAAGKGKGLQATYFRDMDFKEAAFTRVEGKLRFGARNDFDGGEGSPKWWYKDGKEAGVNPARISVRWTGELEPPLSEDYRFGVYLTGSVKIWVNGELVLETAEGRTALSKPVRLQAGKRVSLKIEYRSSSVVKTQFSGYHGPLFHLHWESRTLDRLAIPMAYLYTTGA